MELKSDLSYNELKKLYANYFSLGFLNTDISSKFALISLVAYLTDRFKKKKPDITAYMIIKKIIGYECSEELIKALSVIVEDFMYGCTEFPTFGIEPKDMPNKIKEILRSELPF